MSIASPNLQLITPDILCFALVLSKHCFTQSAVDYTGCSVFCTSFEQALLHPVCSCLRSIYIVGSWCWENKNRKKCTWHNLNKTALHSFIYKEHGGRLVIVIMGLFYTEEAHFDMPVIIWEVRDYWFLLYMCIMGLGRGRECRTVILFTDTLLIMKCHQLFRVNHEVSTQGKSWNVISYSG